jgi:D-alanyl-D-alanine dipeptidase
MVPVLYAVAKKLLVAQNTLLAKGYSIKVYDTYRPHSVSVKIYNSLSGLYDSNTTVKNNILYSYGASGTRYTWGKAWFLASSVSTHNVGAAIDMSLVYKSNGKEVTMPTVMHELSTKAIKYYSSSVSKVPANYSKEMNDMAKIMDSAATNAGLTTLASEWWHFQDNAARDLIVKLQPNGCAFQVTKVYSY